MNNAQINIDLNTPDGVKILRAIADALAPQDAEVKLNMSTPKEVAALLDTDTGEARAFSAPSPDSAERAVYDSDEGRVVEPEEKEKPEKPAKKRRRTKAQIEEDQADGVDEDFKKVSKEHPDWSIDEVRTAIRQTAEESAEASDTPTHEGSTEGSEPESDFSVPEEEPLSGGPPIPDDDDPFDGYTEPDEWKPPWLA